MALSILVNFPFGQKGEKNCSKLRMTIFDWLQLGQVTVSLRMVDSFISGLNWTQQSGWTGSSGLRSMLMNWFQHGLKIWPAQIIFVRQSYHFLMHELNHHIRKSSVMEIASKFLCPDVLVWPMSIHYGLPRSSSQQIFLQTLLGWFFFLRPRSCPVVTGLMAIQIIYFFCVFSFK